MLCGVRGSKGLTQHLQRTRVYLGKLHMRRACKRWCRQVGSSPKGNRSGCRLQWHTTDLKPQCKPTCQEEHGSSCRHCRRLGAHAEHLAAEHPEDPSIACAEGEDECAHGKQDERHILAVVAQRYEGHGAGDDGTAPDEQGTTPLAVHQTNGDEHAHCLQQGSKDGRTQESTKVKQCSLLCPAGPGLPSSAEQPGFRDSDLISVLAANPLLKQW